jgi:glycosyltransferase involved in cell wall biosynthesis
MPYEIPNHEKWKAFSTLLHWEFWKELKWVICKKKFNKGVLNTMLISFYKAKKLKAYLSKETKLFSNHKIYGYSYWCNDNALGLALWKKKNINIKVLCRAHGWDLYEERSDFNYLPYRKILGNNLDGLFFISTQGMKYWKYSYGNTTSLKISRLGTKEVNFKEKEISSKQSHLIVSCSSLIPLKRVHLIIEALSKINAKLKWVHFGGGALLDDLLEKATRLLDNNENIEWELKGQADNQTVLAFYQTEQPDLFINVSETEGVPVSIMEAFSYGIPAIATDVGGVAEMVNEENGYLLPKNLSANQLAENLQKYLDLSAEKKEGKKKAAYATWDEKYNAERNYREFVKAFIDL